MRQALLLVVAASLVAGLVGCVPAGKAVFRVNAGDDKAFTDSQGNKWLPDQEYTAAAKYGAVEGKTIAREGLKEVKGTKDAQLYRTERYSMTAYRFDVPNGQYAVRLHFAETYDKIAKADERVFTVKIQGKPMLKDLDVFKEAGGLAKPLVKDFGGIAVTDGKLMIEFEAKVQNAEINAIEVFKQ